MRKTFQFSFTVATLAITGASASGSSQVRARAFVPTTHKMAKAKDANLLLSIPRGGDLGPIGSETLAKVYSGLVSLDAISGTLAPAATCKLAGIKVSEGSLLQSFMHAQCKND